VLHCIKEKLILIFNAKLEFLMFELDNPDFFVAWSLVASRLHPQDLGILARTSKFFHPIANDFQVIAAITKNTFAQHIIDKATAMAKTILSIKEFNENSSLCFKLILSICYILNEHPISSIPNIFPKLPSTLFGKDDQTRREEYYEVRRDDYYETFLKFINGYPDISYSVAFTEYTKNIQSIKSLAYA
jgi:hypothetical protein